LPVLLLHIEILILSIDETLLMATYNCPWEKR